MVSFKTMKKINVQNRAIINEIVVNELNDMPATTKIRPWEKPGLNEFYIRIKIIYTHVKLQL